MNSGERPARGPHSDYVTMAINAVVVAAEEKNGVDTVVLDVRDLIDAFDVLAVTSGRNDRHVRSLALEIVRLVDLTLDVKPIRVEGLVEGEWVALDYGDVIVHVFVEAAREYYDLEHLWSAAPAMRPEPAL